MPETSTPKPIEKCPHCFHESPNHKCIGWVVRDYTPANGFYLCCECNMGFEGKQTFTLPNDEEDERQIGNDNEQKSIQSGS